MTLYCYMKVLKKYLIIFILIVINTSCSQPKQTKEIENLFKLYNDSSQVNLLKALEYANQASLLAEKYGDSKGKTYSYIYISRSLFFMGYQKESTEFMEKATKEKYYRRDPVAQAMVKQIKHNNYENLGLHLEAIRESFEILKLLNKEKGYDATRIRLRAMCNVISYYVDNKDYNKAKTYLDKAIFLTKDTVFINKEIDESCSYLFFLEARMFQNLHQKDSALLYLQKGVLHVQNNPKKTKYVQYFAIGNFYTKEGNLQQALKYYLLTAEDMELRKWEYSDLRLNTYHRIADIYGKLNNSEKKEFYERKCNNESLKKLNEYNKNVQKTVEIILKEKNEKQSTDRRRIWIIIVLIMFLIFIFSIFAYRKHVYIKKQKDKIIEDHEGQKIILTQNIEKNKFSELIKLAKVNNPHFLILFEELYPRFISKLKELNPKIRNSELSFCAMAYLNFSTKEIAEYTFVTPRSVEKHKSRIRKKHNIPSDESFNRWMRNLENN